MTRTYTERGDDMKNDLVAALEQSLTEGTRDIAANITQMGIDAILKDSTFQGIPIVATVASVYKIGNSIKELHYIKKLAQFVFALNFDVETEEQRQYYINRIQGNRDQANKELEYMLVLLDRYLQFSKVDMLVKLYLAYLRKEITWDSFSIYSEVIDRLMPCDFETLERIDAGTYIPSKDSLMRVSSLGILEYIGEHHGFSINHEDGHLYDSYEEAKYELTDFGRSLKCILFNGHFSTMKE